MYLLNYVFVFFFSRYLASSGITGSYASSIFSSLRKSILFSILAISVKKKLTQYYKTTILQEKLILKNHFFEKSFFSR